MAFITIGLLVVVLCGLSLLLPAFFGPPLVPANVTRIRKALKLAQLKPDEVLYDLGAGDGRVLVIAAREFGARAVGVELGPLQCLIAWLRAALMGLGQRVQVRLGNFYNADLKNADLVYVYATSRETARLAPRLKGQLRPGARVVSISADFATWQPAAFDEQGLIFIYQMPPQMGSLETFLWQRSGAKP
jgi:SAM-dependent methyltransferase